MTLLTPTNTLKNMNENDFRETQGLLPMPFMHPYIQQITAVGSRVTCDPAPTDTDCDWLVLVGDYNLGGLCQDLMSGGWELGGSDLPDDVNVLPDDSKFLSYTKGDDNLIITTSLNFHRRFLAATAVSKRLNLLNKDDRIALFQAVLYGNDRSCFSGVL